MDRYQEQDSRICHRSVMVAAKQVENFNKRTDGTVAILLRSNKAHDGPATCFLYSAFNRLPGNLSELITGGKTSLAAMFEDIGTDGASGPRGRYP